MVNIKLLAFQIVENGVAAAHKVVEFFAGRELPLPAKSLTSQLA
ncbi:hypothetical protein SAOR_10190 [Salinisphaera orenii MK-B5]|uniref:Uncharacterized protein n=2 Tax=Salinisphaera orenii TaxID=856731 RepID=A0A423PLR1_9GAMM|nr:hypothetical protein SAOR_10190 [Salinisphaera orenii MK-B5]ROO33041.1 hypothetical protein SAHL_04360 [Salinisphaera halophila YIM 95161]